MNIADNKLCTNFPYLWLPLSPKDFVDHISCHILLTIYIFMYIYFKYIVKSKKYRSIRYYIMKNLKNEKHRVKR